MNKNYFKQSNPYKNRGSHPAFALILVLLFTAIILILITLISTSLVSGIKLNRQSQNTYEAYNMARDAITDAVTTLRQPTVTTQYLTPLSGVNCRTTDGTGVYYTRKGTASLITKTLSTAVVDYGPNGKFYAYKLCADASNKYIEGRGYSGGQQIILKASVNLKGYYTEDYTYDVIDAGVTTSKTEKCGTDPAFSKQCSDLLASHPDANPVTSTKKFTHDKDLIHIYQVGP